MFTGTMGTINELSPFTNYTCTVLATTVMDGRMSGPITVRTAESGTYCWRVDSLYLNFIMIVSIAPYPPVINSVVNISSSAVRVYWTAPTITNGVITMYTIYVNGSVSDPVPSTDEVSK